VAAGVRNDVDQLRQDGHKDRRLSSEETIPYSFIFGKLKLFKHHG
jgi:hypothetical protein